jgi:hypothetical protein
VDPELQQTVCIPEMLSYITHLHVYSKDQNIIVLKLLNIINDMTNKEAEKIGADLNSQTVFKCI